jgi:hypothetical protein
MDDVVRITEMIKALLPVAGLFAVALALFLRIFDRIIPSRIEKAIEKSATQTDALFRVHLGDTAFDINGRPKWWFPSGIDEKLDQLIVKQDETNRILKELCDKYEAAGSIARALDKQSDAFEAIAQAVKANE